LLSALLIVSLTPILLASVLGVAHDSHTCMRLLDVSAGLDPHGKRIR